MADSIRILIVEDNPADAELMVRELGRGGIDFTHETVNGRSAMEAALGASTLPDIVLSDYSLPDLRGFDVIEAVHQRDPVLPVVIVTGSISEEVAVDCIKAGAADYVIKGNLTRLPVAVRAAVEHARLRVRELALESRLLQAQKLDAIGRLAGGVAHGFNNLLGVITGYADLLEATLDYGHPAMRRLEQIRRATNSAAALTRQLLAFGRRQVLQPVPVELNGLIAEITGMIRRLVPETITIETSLSADAPLVVVDRSQIEQVILDLALNARDAMSGSGTLSIATYCELARSSEGGAPRRRACLEVSDTGVGISDDQMRYLFEPFYTTKKGGTGLGLPTVYGIVRQSGGEIVVTSEPGRGSTFRVFLPLAPPGVHSPGAVESVHAPDAAGRTGLRVLLAEDQEMLREMIQEGLRASGCTVLPAASGQAALALAGDAGEIDLLLTDVVMPGMSGPELAERLRVDRPGLAVLFMSGYSEELIAREGILEHGIDLLHKPFTIDTLMQRIRALLAKQGDPHDQ